MLNICLALWKSEPKYALKRHVSVYHQVNNFDYSMNADLLVKTSVVNEACYSLKRSLNIIFMSKIQPHIR